MWGSNSALHMDEPPTKLVKRPLRQSPVRSVPGDPTTLMPASNFGPIPFEIFRPRASVRGPAILFVHGAFGLTPSYYPFIHHLVESGYVIVAPLYFARTGTVCGGPKEVEKHFFAWVGSLIDSMFELRSRADVDSSRVGIAGISLGASLSLALAAQCSGIKAVVEFFGEVPDLSLASLMPPTLIVHGGADRHVPLAKVLKLAHALRQRNTPCELEIYAGQRHVIGTIAFHHAMRQATAFFDKYLKNE
jgi:carboxymethylenebutenolidase